MSQAITLFTTIWQKIIRAVFVQMDVTGNGVTIGWIILVVSIMAMIIRSIAAIPIGVFTSGTQVTESESAKVDTLRGGVVHTKTVSRSTGRGRL